MIEIGGCANPTEKHAKQIRIIKSSRFITFPPFPARNEQITGWLCETNRPRSIDPLIEPV